jgi:uncharacterized protein (DUF2236 family)
VSVAQRVNAERLVLFGWSRAILMQLAHPLVAAGVAEHSSFRAGTFTAAVRLQHTIRSMLSLTFGTEADQAATIDRINAIHRGVHGVLEHSAGAFDAGHFYSAEDPALLVWVHATLLESIPLVYEQLVGPLSNVERDQYCLEAEPVVRALGVHDDHVPTSWQALRSYLDAMYASGKITVSSSARELAQAVLAPPFARAVGPVASLNRLITAGLLPRGLREQYGLSWTEKNDQSLRRWTGMIRRTRPLIPRSLALWPEARRGL